MTSAESGGVIAVDIGGTSLKGLALDEEGRLVGRRDVATPSGGDAVLEALGDLVDSLRGVLEAEGVTLRRIGVACPGLVDSGSGVVRFASNLGWRDVELRQWLTERYGVTAVVENDARAGAVAEHAWAGADGADDLAFVPVGTGVAAAYFVDGALVRGATEAAGEFGHLRAVPEGELCTCGNRGCVEVYTSAANILARYQRAGGQATSTPEIARSIREDPVAQRVWSEAVDALAVGLASLVTLLDPSRIVVGGGLSRAGDALLTPLRTRLDQQLSWRDRPLIQASALASHSTLAGAALLGRGVGGFGGSGGRDAKTAVRQLGLQLELRERAVQS